MSEATQPQTFGLDPENPFTSVPIEVTVCVGRARPSVRDLVKLGENSVLALDRSVEDPVELYVGDRLIARGMLEENDKEVAGQLIVRLTEVIELNSNL